MARCGRVELELPGEIAVEAEFLRLEHRAGRLMRFDAVECGAEQHGEQGLEQERSVEEA